MARETKDEAEARKGGEREARAGLEYHKMMRQDAARTKTARKARKTRR